MSSIQYTTTSRAELVSGHSVGVLYGFDIKLNQYTPMRSAPKSQHVSLNGKVETVLRGLVKYYSITLGPYPNSLHDDIVEFVESVAGGEIFAFDPYGSIAVPDSPISLIMTDVEIPETRITHGLTPYRILSITARLAV